VSEPLLLIALADRDAAPRWRPILFDLLFGYWAQLAFCCGFTAFLIVRVPTRLLMSTCILCWGTTMIGLAFSKSFGPLLANRFLLGMFEAINIPLFSLLLLIRLVD
jgi:hypothetical protein